MRILLSLSECTLPREQSSQRCGTARTEAQTAPRSTGLQAGLGGAGVSAAAVPPLTSAAWSAEQGRRELFRTRFVSALLPNNNTNFVPGVGGSSQDSSLTCPLGHYPLIPPAVHGKSSPGAEPRARLGEGDVGAETSSPGVVVSCTIPPQPPQSGRYIQGCLCEQAWHSKEFPKAGE